MAAGAAVNTNAGAKRRYKLWLLFIVMFLGWAAYTLFGQLEQQNETSLKFTSLEEQVKSAVEKNEALKLEIERLNDPEYIAQLATKEQGMVKQGEKQIFSE